MLIAHKVELRPTKEQADYLNKCIGCSRHLYNQLWAHFKQDGVKWSKKAATVMFHNLRANEFPFYGEISSDFLRVAIRDLDNGYKHFFRRCKIKGVKSGYPKPRKLGVTDICALRTKEKFRVTDKGLHFEKFNMLKRFKPIKMREKLRFSGVVKQMNIRRKAGKYFCSFLIDTDEYNPKDVGRQSSVGVDFGIKNMAICSDGTKFEANQKFKASRKRLARKQRKMARQVQGSNRRAKTKLSIQKLHMRIANQRNALHHKISDYVTSNYDRVVIENLNVKGMLKNRKLSRAIADSAFSKLRRQITYKSKWRNCELVIADRFFASSKTCSACGFKNVAVVLGVDNWECPECHVHHDRDINAAINLNNYQVPV